MALIWFYQLNIFCTKTYFSGLGDSDHSQHLQIDGQYILEDTIPFEIIEANESLLQVSFLLLV